MPAQIQINQAALAEFCRRNGIRRLALFGSVTRQDFRPDSDVDVLVEFAPDRVPGLFRMVALELELTKMVGRKVDLRTPAELSRYFRAAVMDSAEIQYAEV